MKQLNVYILDDCKIYITVIMRKGRRRKTEHEDEPSCKRVCIIHKPSVPETADFTLIRGDGGELSFQHLQSVRDRRLQDPPGSNHRQLDICNQIPDELTEGCGYHRACYRSFTGKAISHSYFMTT